MTLDQLAEKHGTDKGTRAVKSGLVPKAYTLAYAKHLARLCGWNCRLLEIGIATGASLRMWKEWLPEADIIGVDENLAAVRSVGPEARAYHGSQADITFLDLVGREAGPFDAIIDDGSHQSDDQRASLAALWPWLSPGGVYAIEDLHALGAAEMVVTLHAGCSGLARGATWLHGLASIHWYSRLVILVKGTS